MIEPRRERPNLERIGGCPSRCERGCKLYLCGGFIPLVEGGDVLVGNGEIVGAVVAMVGGVNAREQ